MKEQLGWLKFRSSPSFPKDDIQFLYWESGLSSLAVPSFIALSCQFQQINEDIDQSQNSLIMILVTAQAHRKALGLGSVPVYGATVTTEGEFMVYASWQISVSNYAGSTLLQFPVALIKYLLINYAYKESEQYDFSIAQDIVRFDLTNPTDLLRCCGFLVGILDHIVVLREETKLSHPTYINRWRAPEPPRAHAGPESSY